MAQQPKTGAAQTTSMSEFLLKAKKLSEAKPLGTPSQPGKTRNYGAATRKSWPRQADAAGQQPEREDASPPDTDAVRAEGEGER
jgi:hypothetical protein